MSAPRGSAEAVNDIFSNSVKRAKTIIDQVAKVAAESGYPALTEPITLRDLNAMPQEQAVAVLRAEIARTTQGNVATGDQRISPKTLELVTKYLEGQQNGVQPHA